MSPEEFGKAVYCPARRSVKEGSHESAILLQRRTPVVALASQAFYAQWFAYVGGD
jgi:hypothetical protein